MLLALVVLVLAVPVVEPLMAQQASRYALTAALVDHRSVVIDPYAGLLSVDWAERDGQRYSDKAPGQPFLAVPAYALYRLAGGEPAEAHRPRGNVGLWAVSTWSAAVPAALLIVLMRRAALRVAPERATAAALGMATSTMLLPFATVLFSHVLAGMLLLGAYLVLPEGPLVASARGRLASRGLIGGAGARLLVVGFLAAAAIVVEYSAALAGSVLLAVAVLRPHGPWRASATRRSRTAGGARRVCWLVAGGLLPALALAAYHWTAFGGPLSFSYAHSYFAAIDAPGAGLPRPGMLARVLVGERGLLILTPVVAAGLAGSVSLLRRRDAPSGHMRPAGRERAAPGEAAWSPRVDGAVALAVLVLFLALMAGWPNATGGASPGPRYVVPALPFLVFGVAEAFRRWPVATWAATAVGVATMALATFTLPLAPRDVVAVVWWWERLADGRLADLVLGGSSWVVIVMLATATALAAAAVRLGDAGSGRFTRTATGVDERS